MTSLTLLVDCCTIQSSEIRLDWRLGHLLALFDLGTLHKDLVSEETMTSCEAFWIQPDADSCCIWLTNLVFGGRIESTLDHLCFGRMRSERVCSLLVVCILQSHGDVPCDTSYLGLWC